MRNVGVTGAAVNGMIELIFFSSKELCLRHETNNGHSLFSNMRDNLAQHAYAK
jgi:hypothetical protein